MSHSQSTCVVDTVGGLVQRADGGLETGMQVGVVIGKEAISDQGQTSATDENLNKG